MKIKIRKPTPFKIAPQRIFREKKLLKEVTRVGGGRGGDYIRAIKGIPVPTEMFCTLF